ncbi:unnamed protein product [Adineta steineri]|uniref:G-protein coupled receptors family 1 profile domain-containing protein n=1 Tax=Adineta steineri TaxID=433720 RepID=A0A814AWH0_9BILA|nr:unnamed protein product [Adineta steineri]CAF3672082.1 unnamed protein product [Adineta steineri]
MSTLTLIYRYGGLTLLTLGSVSSILNLLVFTSSTLRKNPCAICFIAMSIIDLLYLYLSLLLTIFQNGFNMNIGSTNLVFCRSFYYLGLILGALGPTYLIVASIDRTLVTSRNAGTRRKSTRRLAIVCLISLALFWTLFQIHALIYIKIIEIAPEYFICYFQPGAYTVFITYYSLFGVGILPPLLMTIFGFLTVKNIRQIHRPINHSHSSTLNTMTVGRSFTVHSKDRQLIRMLIVEIIIYLIARFPSTIVLIYDQITVNQIKSADRISTEQFIANITYFMGFIDSSVACYTNMIVSKNFRAELKRIFKCR